MEYGEFKKTLDMLLEKARHGRFTRVPESPEYTALLNFARTVEERGYDRAMSEVEASEAFQS